MTEAGGAALPGLPILVTLDPADELDVLPACFEVGGECHSDVTDDLWASVLALIDQEHRSGAGY